MTDPTPKAQALAEELLGGIHYADSRDKPAWKKKVIESAARLIDQEMRAAVEEALEWIDTAFCYEVASDIDCYGAEQAKTNLEKAHQVILAEMFPDSHD